MKTNVKRKVVLLFTLVMVMTMLPCVAFAASTDPALIDTTITGSITVTKYANTNASTSKGTATGKETDGSSIATGYEPLNGATFKLFKIADANAAIEYYNGISATTYDLGSFNYDASTNTATYNSVAILDENIWTGTTAGTGVNAGKYKFTGLSVGIYVLKEVTAPDQITTPLAEDSLISIPMVNTETSRNNENAEWMYDVYVYPKNHESTGTVELTKQDQNRAALQNVVFELYKKEFQSDRELRTGNWTQVTQTTNNAGEPASLTLQTNSEGKITLANLPSGLYGTQYKLVEIYQADTSPEGYIINSNPLYFKVNNDNTISWNAGSGEKGDCNNTNTGVIGTLTPTTDPKLSITLRNEIPSLTKKVHKNGGTTWKKDEQYRLDDEITYRLIAYVPNNVAELVTYEIKDIPQVGITDSGVSSDYAVSYGDTANTFNNTLTSDQYNWNKIDASGSNGQGFILTLTNVGKATTAGKFIQIVYKAHMNSNAVIAGVGNGNTATLTYSKYIGSTDATKYTITDEARVYTYQYQITKYKDSVAEENKIGNVEFNLLYAENGTAIDVYKEADGVYRLWLASDTDTTKKKTTLVTKGDGTILIQGLENGTYYLKETKTIDGYNLLSAPFEITLNVVETTTWNPDNTFTSTGQVVKTYESTHYDVYDAKGTSTIINKKGFVLPQTGGMGYLLFCAVGILLIGGGAALIFGGRKKKIR